MITKQYEYVDNEIILIPKQESNTNTAPINDNMTLIRI